MVKRHMIHAIVEGLIRLISSMIEPEDKGDMLIYPLGPFTLIEDVYTPGVIVLFRDTVLLAAFGRINWMQWHFQVGPWVLFNCNDTQFAFEEIMSMVWFEMDNGKSAKNGVWPPSEEYEEAIEF